MWRAGVRGQSGEQQWALRGRGRGRAEPRRTGSPAPACTGPGSNLLLVPLARVRRLFSSWDLSARPGKPPAPRARAPEGAQRPHAIHCSLAAGPSASSCLREHLCCASTLNYLACSTTEQERKEAGLAPGGGGRAARRGWGWLTPVAWSVAGRAGSLGWLCVVGAPRTRPLAAAGGMSVVLWLLVRDLATSGHPAPASSRAVGRRPLPRLSVPAPRSSWLSSEVCFRAAPPRLSSSWAACQGAWRFCTCAECLALRGAGAGCRPWGAC